MKLLLVLGSDKTFDSISVFFKPPEFELIRYRHVIKAMDNVDEIDPVGIIISAKDFPRHWKTMVRFVRHSRSKDECPIVILKGDFFSEEEFNKATALDVNGVVPESLDNHAETEKIRTIFAGHMPAEGKPKDRPRFDFVFSRPADGRLVTGKVKTVSSTGIFFEPDHPELVENIKVDTEIQNCSLRAGQEILFPVCAVRRIGNIVFMEFLSFPGVRKEALGMHLENLPPEG